jgi:site-specific DNA-methyltransferase (adenine-specific)
MSVIHMECLPGMRMFPDNMAHSVVTDPPYGLTSKRPNGRSEATRGKVMGGFMGLKWDYDVPSVEEWREAYRLLRPGGYLLAFGGTRTYHRLVCAIEDAGFEIRDQIGWAFGSGFPKSHNGEWGGTALKPAWEPICVARKPLEGTVEENWRKWGTGALAIDACRVGDEAITQHGRKDGENTSMSGRNYAEPAGRAWEGRWPANLIHDGSDEVLAAFPTAPGQMADASSSSDSRKTQNVYGAMARGNEQAGARRGDAGSAARFFYCAKASKSDRDEGLDHVEAKAFAMSNQGKAELARGNMHESDNGLNSVKMRKNAHPTVKPTALMRYLCRLFTPAGGLVIDPWAGSGSTGKAAVLEGFGFLGFEREAEHVEIANARIAHARSAA